MATDGVISNRHKPMNEERGSQRATAICETVRVLISSTFRDMHAEQDWLVKVLFLELRERMARRNLYLVDVDLRWGVTEE